MTPQGGAGTLSIDALSIAGCRLLFRARPRVLWGSLGLALLAAVFDRTATLALIDLVSGTHVALVRVMVVVVVAVAGTLGFARWAYIYGLRSAETVSDATILRLVRHITSADLHDIERIGPAALQSTIMREAETLLDAASTIFLALPAAMTVLLTAAWLAAEQPQCLLAFIAIAVFAAVVPWRPASAVHAGEAQLAAAEGAFDETTAQFASAEPGRHFDVQANLDSRKERLWSALNHSVQANATAGRAQANWTAWHQWLGFVLVVLLMEFAPAELGTGSWRVALLLTVATLSPARSVLGALPALCRAGDIAGRLDVFTAGLKPAKPQPAMREPAWETIELRNVHYTYRDHKNNALATVGPLNFHLRKGEAVALIGGKGSGRTTLSRLLSGLYTPSEGAVLVDGYPASPALLRSLCGGVLADLPPLRRLRQPTAADRARIQALLAEFELDQFILLDRGGTVPAGLSDSQHARLALVAAEIDGRSLRIYDEWPVGQEERFRERFHTSLLQELRARGCTLLVIGDNSAFSTPPDRIVSMEAGQIVTDEPGDTVS